jgi:hypothetical protein
MSKKYSTEELVESVEKVYLERMGFFERLIGSYPERNAQYDNRDAIIARLKAADKLYEILKKTASWYERRIAQSERQEKQNRGRFNSLADACAFDAKNYRIQLEEARKAIAEYERKEEK